MRMQMDSAGDFSVSDLIKRRQSRREAKVEWSDRMLGSSKQQNFEAVNIGANMAGSSDTSKLKQQFFSLLIDDCAAKPDEKLFKECNSSGTRKENSLLNKQEEQKKNPAFTEYEISTRDFGVAKVEVQVSSNQVLLVMHVAKFVPEQHTQILQRLVATRLGCQFGKNFEVEIKCKS